MGEGDFREDPGLLPIHPDTVCGLGIGRGEEDSSPRGTVRGEEFVRLRILISMGEDSAEEGEEFGLWSAVCCMRGEEGDVE